MSVWFGSSGGGLPNVLATLRRFLLPAIIHRTRKASPCLGMLGWLLSHHRSGSFLDSKNGVNRGYDLVHGSIDVNRKTNQVVLAQGTW